MKKIACVGYHGTGAGVIDDLLREFDNIAHGAYECESRYLHDADGVADLEYNLVENPHRLNSSFAVFRFLAYAQKNNKQLSKVYGDAWLRYAKEYADSITQFKYNGFKGREPEMYSRFEKYRGLFNKIKYKLTPKSIRKKHVRNYYPWQTTLHARLSETEFLEKTMLFVNNLCNSVPHEETDEYVVLDQMFAGYNIERYLRYVDDIKVIIVDRDPRDLYIRQRHMRDHVLPNDPLDFCTYYRDIRPNPSKSLPENVMLVSFEDMIYDYDNMVEKVMKFLEIDPSHHVSPKKYFNPNISIRGTKQWERISDYNQDLKIIEKELPEFIHQYK